VKRGIRDWYVMKKAWRFCDSAIVTPLGNKEGCQIPRNIGGAALHPGGLS